MLPGGELEPPTQSKEASNLPRAVVSSGIRFFGGAIGAPVGTGLAALGAGVPFLFAASTAVVGALLLAIFRVVLPSRRKSRPV